MFSVFSHFQDMTAVAICDARRLSSFRFSLYLINSGQRMQRTAKGDLSILWSPGHSQIRGIENADLPDKALIFTYIGKSRCQSRRFLQGKD